MLLSFQVLVNPVLSLPALVTISKYFQQTFYKNNKGLFFQVLVNPVLSLPALVLSRPGLLRKALPLRGPW